jgi:HD-GYP domain-containing protein (c-di-GMP phosphodiesterase class II)/CHASE3 domain sensor protein
MFQAEKGRQPMLRTPAAHVSAIGFSIAIAILLGVGISTYASLRDLMESDRMSSHTRNVLAMLDRTLVLLTNAETGQRGYVITGDSAYLAPYAAAVTADTGIEQTVAQLRRLTLDNPEQQRRLDALEPLIQARLDLINETITIRRTDGFAAAQRHVASNIGKRTMDAIRTLIDEMHRTENVLLQQRAAAAAASMHRVQFSLILGAVASFALLAGSYYLISYEAGERLRAEQAVRHLNDSLDQRVQQQTLALAAANTELRAEIATRIHAEESIRDSEQRLRSTLDTMLEGCQIIGFDWRYIYLNDAAVVQGRQPRAQLIGRTMMEAYPGIEETPLFRALEQTMHRRISQQLENEFQFPNGVTGWFELSIQAVPEGIFILSQEITERKRAETHIEQQLQRLQSLRMIDMAILGATDLRLMLRVVLEQAMARLNTDIAAILRFNATTMMLEMSAISGNRFPETARLTMRIGEGVTGRAALEGHTIAMPMIDSDQLPAWLRPIVAQEGLHAVYATPLIARGNLIGVFQVAFREPFDAAQHWIDFFEALAGQAAMAIDSGDSFAVLQRANRDLKLAYDTTIEGWSNALDLRDKETEGHSQRVTEMTIRLAQQIGMRDEELIHVRRGALLHDVGKLGIPDNILLKPGPLTDGEWEIMRRHPLYAYEWLHRIAYLQPALDIPYCHHERWDGSGYPRGLQGEQIPLAARLFAVVDTWDALRSDRPYRAGWPEEHVIAHIRSLAGSHFDPQAVAAFLSVLAEDAGAVKQYQVGEIGE